jgi:hypothetical protein
VSGTFSGGKVSGTFSEGEERCQEPFLWHARRPVLLVDAVWARTGGRCDRLVGQAGWAARLGSADAGAAGPDRSRPTVVCGQAGWAARFGSADPGVAAPDRSRPTGVCALDDPALATYPFERVPDATSSRVLAWPKAHSRPCTSSRPGRRCSWSGRKHSASWSACASVAPARRRRHGCL